MNKRKKLEFDKQIGDGLREIANLAAQCSGGRLRLAQNEEDESEKTSLNASHFLKLDEKRLGKDIEMYIFLGHRDSWHEALNQFIIDIILPLAEILPESYKKATEGVNKLRECVYLKEVGEKKGNQESENKR